MGVSLVIIYLSLCKEMNVGYQNKFIWHIKGLPNYITEDFKNAVLPYMSFVDFGHCCSWIGVVVCLVMNTEALEIQFDGFIWECGLKEFPFID